MRAPRGRHVVAAFLALGASTAAAQTVVYTPDFDPDHYVLTSDPDSIGLTESANPMASGRFAAGFALRIGGAPLSVCVEDDDTGACTEQGDLVSGRLVADLTAAMGFGRFGVHLQLPVVLYQGSDFEPAMNGASLESAAVGDLRVGGKVRLARFGAVTVGWDLTASVPTGGGNSFVGDRGTVIENRALADWRSGRTSAVASAGYAWRSHASRLGDLYVDDEVLWSVAGEYAFRPDLAAGVSMFGRVGVIADPDPEMTSGAPSWAERPAEVMASARYRLASHLVLEVGAGTAIGSGYGTSPFRGMVGARWTNGGTAPRRARLVEEVVAPEPEPAVEVAEIVPPPPLPPPPEPAPPPPPEPAVATVTDDAIVITDRIQFETDQATIETESFPVLDAVATILADTELRIRIEGHTDDVGKASWNLTLGLLRAEAVRDYLIGKGIAADRLEAQGFGSSQPRVAGKSRAARLENRRVEFVILR
jgi:OOP family OmpA-OmpF porin